MTFVIHYPVILATVVTAIVAGAWFTAPALEKAVTAAGSVPRRMLYTSSILYTLSFIIGKVLARFL